MSSDDAYEIANAIRFFAKCMVLSAYARGLGWEWSRVREEMRSLG